MQIHTAKPPAGFTYVPQDNYILYRPARREKSYLYADSATSCVIIIVTGLDKTGAELVAITHLGGATAAKAFFEIVESSFAGGFSLFAQGANPSGPVSKQGALSFESMKNIGWMLAWIGKLLYHPSKSPPPAYISRLSLVLGRGDPNAGYGALGVDVDPSSRDYLKVSNKYFALTPNDRDPEGGLQRLFSRFGQKTGLPSLVMRDADKPFTPHEKAALIALARRENWQQILDMSDSEILDKYSTTPEHEPYWFCETARQSAQYLLDL